MVLILICSLILQFLSQYHDFTYRPDGQAWRWLSGHFVHNNLPHWLINSLSLALLYALGRGLDTINTLLLKLPVLAVLSSGIFYYCYPQLQWYVGLSGVLHGLALLIALALIRERDRTGYLLAVGLLMKIAWEQSPLYDGSLTAQWIELRVATEAHLAGVLSALILLGVSAGYRALLGQRKAS